VFAEKQALESVKSVVLSIASLTSGEETDINVLCECRDKLRGDGNVGVVGVYVFNERHPLAIETNLIRWDCSSCSRNTIWIGRNS
jgi:hypothetical protein